MQLSGQLMQEKVHLGFDFQHSIQINGFCN